MERMCIGCREMADKKQLIRVVKGKESGTRIDITGKANGRGAYICKNIDCLEKAKKQKQFERAFKTAMDDSLFEELRQGILGKPAQDLQDIIERGQKIPEAADGA